MILTGLMMAEVFICSNRWCRERGAASTLGASIALMKNKVVPHKCFGRCGIGPNVAVLSNDTVLEFHHVDSVEKVVRIARHLGERVDVPTAKCLELVFEAAGKAPEQQVHLYTKALETKVGS